MCLGQYQAQAIAIVLLVKATLLHAMKKLVACSLEIDFLIQILPLPVTICVMAVK